MHDLLNTMNDFCKVLIQMERNGIKVDIDALDKLESEYKKEYESLNYELELLARNSMGDIPFRLTSKDDLSMIIFSRKPKDKKKWAEVHNDMKCEKDLLYELKLWDII